MSTVACGSGAPSVSQNCWPTRWISLCLHWEHILGVIAPETKKNILVILVYLCSRPAQGGGAGLVTTKIKLRHYLYYCLPLEKLKKYFGVPEAQKIFWCTCALDPPWGGSGGSGTVTTKIKVCQNPHYLYYCSQITQIGIYYIPNHL